MVNQYLDLTDTFNNNSGVVQFEIGSYNYVVAHIINNSATISFKASVDGGAIGGVADNAALTATNFVTVEGLNLSTAANATSIVATAAPGTLFQFGVVGRYLQFSGGGTVTKLLVQLSKIQ